MKLAWFIASRYFFSKKKYHAINIISLVSILSVATITAAAVCVLSVMNGFETVIKNMCCQCDPQLKILPQLGKYLTIQPQQLKRLNELDGIACTCQMIEEEALIRYKDFQTGARLIGVDDYFETMSQIDKLITDGSYSIFDGAFERTVMGRGLAHTVGTNAHFVDGIDIFVPRRTRKINMVNPKESILNATVFIAGTFAVNQAKYDDEIMFISIQLARQLFELDANTVSYLGIKMKNGVSQKQTRKDITAILGNNIIIQNQEEQQQDFYKMVQVEKGMTAIFLALILLIASFNIISSLYMVIIDKHDAIATFYKLGMKRQRIKQIFHYQGWLISLFGGLLGVIIGTILCLCQQQFGWLKIGTGTNYVISTYPVHVLPLDLLLIFTVVALCGWIMTYIPTFKIKTATYFISEQ